MTDLAKGILGGGWLLLIGWLFPTAINVVIFTMFVLPSLRGEDFNAKSMEAASKDSLAILGVTVAIGILLNALSRSLYRILEGYVLWPEYAFKKGVDRQKSKISRLKSKAANANSLPLFRSLAQERLANYPVSVEKELAPTRLGNAIRRSEEYAANRYQMDSQTLWYELQTAAPSEITRQGDAARGTMDLFICLLYGHLVVALVSVCAFLAGCRNGEVLLTTAVLALFLARVWYVVACRSAGEWAAAQQAIVNLGRKPLAEALGLPLPDNSKDEREMWSTITWFVKQPYDPAQYAGNFDRFRASSKGDSENKNE